MTVTYAITINPDAPAGTILTNRVIAEGKDPDHPGVAVPSSCGETGGDGCASTVTVRVAGLELKKTSEPATGGSVAPGQVVTYTLAGTNTGNVDLSPAVLTDDLSTLLRRGTLVPGSPAASVDGQPTTGLLVAGDQLTWSGPLPAGAVVTVTFGVRLAADLAPGETLVNRVAGGATDLVHPERPVTPVCAGGADENCVSTLVARVPALELTKVSTPATGSFVRPGQTITYTVTAHNAGNVGLDPVTLTDDLSDVLQNATTTGTPTASVGGQPVAAPHLADGTLTWTGPLAAGETVVVTYQVTLASDVVATDTLENQVTGVGVDKDRPDAPPVPATCVGDGCSSHLTTGVPGLEIEKSADPASGRLVRPGEVVTYTITGRNTGNLTLDPVTLTDDLTAVLNHASLLADTVTATIDGTPAAPPVVQGTTLTWQGALPAYQTVTLTVGVKVADTLAAGDGLVNRVWGLGTDPGHPTAPPVSTCATGVEDGCLTEHPARVPGFTVTKESDPASGSVVYPGDIVTYTVTGTNTGNVRLDPVTLTDDVAGVLGHGTVVTRSLKASIDDQTVAAPALDGTTLTWQGALDAGQSVKMTYQVTINHDVPPAQSLVNRVAGLGTDPGDGGRPVPPANCTPGADADCTSTLTVADPRFTVTKVSDPASGQLVRPGQTITYTVTGANLGNVDLEPATLTDDLADVLSHATLVGTPQAAIDGDPVDAPTLDGTTLTWEHTLAAGQTVTLTYQVTAHQGLTATDVITNRVTGEGTDPGNPAEPVVPPRCGEGTDDVCTSSLTPAVPGLQVLKVSNPPSGSFVRPGDEITYTLTGTNTGNLRLDPVTLTDDLSNVLASASPVAGAATATIAGEPVAGLRQTGPALTWTGPLAPGQTVTVTYKVTVDAGLTLPDTLVNRVTGQGIDPEHPTAPPVTSRCVTGAEPGCSATLTTGRPAFDVTKTSVPLTGAVIQPGETITYTLTGTNTGNVPLNPVVLTDNLTGVLAFAALVGTPTASIGGTPVAGLSQDGTKLNWAGELGVGQTVTVTYQVRTNADLTPGVQLINRVIADAIDPTHVDDHVPSTCVTGAEPGCVSLVTTRDPRFEVTKVSQPATGAFVQPGETITYTLTGTNTGNVDLGEATLSDDLAPVLALADLTGSPQAQIGGTDAGTLTRDGTTLTWSGPLAVGQSVVVTFRATVKAAAPGEITNRVQASARDPQGHPVTSDCADGTAAACVSQVWAGTPGLDVAKVSVPPTGSSVHPGGTITYTLTAKNTGGTTLDPVTLTDDLAPVLAHVQVVPGSLAATMDQTAVAPPKVEGTTLAWSGAVPAGSLVTVTYQVQVGQDIQATDTLVNRVVGTGRDPAHPTVPVTSTCVLGTEDACHSTLTPALPGLSVTKVSDPASGGYVTPGQTITYTLTGRNTGNVDLAPATLTDNLAGVLPYATVDPGSVTATIDGAPAPAPVLGETALTWSGPLAAGQTVTVTFQASVKAGLRPVDRLVNHVSGTGIDPGTPDHPVVPPACGPGDAGCTSTLTPTTPGFTLAKTSDPKSGSFVTPGQVVTYTLTGTNTGHTGLESVALTDDLSGVLAHATYVTGSAGATIAGQPVAAPSLSGTTLTWSGPLPAEQTVLVTYQVKVGDTLTVADQLVNAVSGAGVDPAHPDRPLGPANCTPDDRRDCVSVLRPDLPGLRVVKTSDPVTGSLVRAGQTVTYTLTGTNSGTTDLDPVTVTDDLAGVLAHASLDPASLRATVDGAPAPAPGVTGTTLTWEGALRAGQTVVVTYAVTTVPDLRPGDRLVNVVAAEGIGPDNRPVTPPACVPGTDDGCNSVLTAADPRFEVTKTSAPESGATVRGGQTVVYTLLAANTGDVGLNPVTLADDLSGVLDKASLLTDTVAAQIDGQPAAAPVVSGTRLTWSGELPAGRTLQVTYAVKLADDLAPTNLIRNAVSAVATDPADPGREVTPDCGPGGVACTSVLTPGVPGFAVTKVSDPPSGGFVQPGQVVTYTVTGQNTGNVGLAPATLSDDLAGVLAHADLVAGSVVATVDGQPVAAPEVVGTGLAWSGPLAPGATVTLTYQVKVRPGLGAADALVNRVTGVGVDPGHPDRPVLPPDCGTGEPDRCQSVLQPDRPGLSVTKVSDPPSGSLVHPGQTVTYTLTGHNTGNVDLDPVTLTDDLADVLAHGGLSVGSLRAAIDGTPVAPPSLTGPVLTWRGPVPAGETVVVTYEVVIDGDLAPGDTLVNAVTGAGVDPHRPDLPVVPPDCQPGGDAGCTTSLTGADPRFTVTKVSDPASGAVVRPGQTVTYTLTAVNTGNVDLDPVTLTDHLDGVLAHARLVEGSLAATRAGTAVAAPTLSGTTLTWSGGLPAGQTVVVTYQVTTRDDLTPTDKLVNQVSALGTDPTNPGQVITPPGCGLGDPGCTSTLIPGFPGVQITKVADPPSGSSVTPGTVVTYTLTGRNTGNVALDPVTLTDDLTGVLPQATLVEDSPRATADGRPTASPVRTGDTLSWTGPLAVGETVTVTYQVRVNPGATGTLVNRVTGTGVDPGHPDVVATCGDGTELTCRTTTYIGVSRPPIHAPTGGVAAGTTDRALAGLGTAGVMPLILRRWS
ncbi:MAG: isopeptide-forming domain-containing fimbrial protein [Propionibacteriaceae bacterium]|nr:isopeptide-forming domain-containing fimbrial protein [Propionibacteriaceae bacterium]